VQPIARAYLDYPGAASFEVRGRVFASLPRAEGAADQALGFLAPEVVVLGLSAGK
jgi:hypothetical protein